jgi:hypothetical protein
VNAYDSRKTAVDGVTIESKRDTNLNARLGWLLMPRDCRRCPKPETTENVFPPTMCEDSPLSVDFDTPMDNSATDLGRVTAQARPNTSRSEDVVLIIRGVIDNVGYT